MIGFLITGHGDFSVGLQSSLNMIAGEQDALEIVPFQENADLEVFQQELRASLNILIDECEGVIIFTDLLGGSPFRSAMLLATEYGNIETLTGTNLPMLLEGTALRFTEDAKELASALVESGKTGVGNPQIDSKENIEEKTTFEGGI